MVVVHAELHAVVAVAPREVVGELVALLGTAHVAERLAPDEREAGNVDTHAAAAGSGREVVEQAAPRVLEAELVQLVCARDPRVLEGDAGVAIRLLRRARISVLPEVFRRALRVHLDAG